MGVPRSVAAPAGGGLPAFHGGTGSARFPDKRGTIVDPTSGITMGDPAGVGPEIIAKACKVLKPQLDADELRLLVIGSNDALNRPAGPLHRSSTFPR